MNGLVLALGGGGARALAHIGVIEVLAREGIPVQAIVGTSVGAEVGALCAAGVDIAEIRGLASRLDWVSTMRLFTPDFSEAGLSTGKGIRSYLAPYLEGREIDRIEVGYAAIATDLYTGEEVVLDRGDLLDAVRASISFPGLLSPVTMGERLLVDGGLVNPVPFDVARRLFGGPVLAVATYPGDKLTQEQPLPAPKEWEKRLDELIGKSWLSGSPQLLAWLEGFRRVRNRAQNPVEDFGISDVLAQSQNISEKMLVNLRARLCPPDLMLQPDTSRIGMLEFYRSRDAIAAGRESVEASLPEIHRLIGG
ncbi:MAG TPA: patatin-like phospholipase family protein [Mariprofundaceae bacterium]|nr:patatin-like phospholipase family protein [Mariprofundaceae bacterium]